DEHARRRVESIVACGADASTAYMACLGDPGRGAGTVMQAPVLKRSHSLAQVRIKRLPMLVRTSKALLTFLLGLFALLIGLDNIIDYGTNLAFVQHVLSMDTTLPGNKLMWRAITSEWVHHLAYALIIAAELATGALCSAGAWRLFQTRNARAQAFNGSKERAISGLVA